MPAERVCRPGLCGMGAAGPVPPTLCPHSANSSSPGETARKASRRSKLLGEVTTEPLPAEKPPHGAGPDVNPAPPRRGRSGVGFPGRAGRLPRMPSTGTRRGCTLPPGRALLEKPPHLGPGAASQRPHCNPSCRRDLRAFRVIPPVGGDRSQRRCDSHIKS